MKTNGQVLYESLEGSRWSALSAISRFDYEVRAEKFLKNIPSKCTKTDEQTDDTSGICQVKED